jgi:CO/xanthine dehydrogenase Mo-binding subunit
MTAAGTRGTRQLRVEDARLLTGRGYYVGDVVLPGMLEAVFVRSTTAHARIDAIRYDFAVGMGGVETVLVAQDLPEVTMTSTRHPSLLVTPQPPLAGDRVRYVGEPVAMVLAEDRYVGEDAAGVVEVDYHELPSSMDRHEAGSDLFTDIPDNKVFHDQQVFGQPDAAFEAAALVVRRRVAVSRQLACPLETRGCVADYDPSSRRLRVWCSTQAPHRLGRDLATVTGLPESQISVVMHDIGGAFGQKIPTHLEEVAVVLASMAAGRPVRWIEDRHENLVAAPHSRGQELDVELALDAEGTFTGLRAAIVGDSGAYSFNSASCLTEAYHAARALPGPYAIGSYAYDVTIRLTNASPIAPYRGVGFVAAQAARELAIHEAAKTLRLDPFELRRRNLVSADQLPYTTPTGWVLRDLALEKVLETAQDDLARVTNELNPCEKGFHRGVGISPYVEPSGVGSEGEQQVHGFKGSSHDSARVKVNTAGTATLSFGTPSMGQGLETTMAQVAADALGIGLDQVSVTWSDTSEAPVSLTGSRSSRTAVVTGGAIARAATKVRREILAVAASMLEAEPADLETRDSMVWVRGEGQPRLTIAEVVRAGFFDPDHRDGDEPRSFEATSMFDPPASYSSACVIAVVDVEEATGAARLRRLVAVEDCGTMINPMIVEGQFVGAAAQGVGSALLERAVYSPEGQPLSSTLVDYVVPTAADLVRVDLSHVETPSTSTEGGTKGMAESGVIGTVAAIACAVDDAVSHAESAVTSLPLLPHVIWELLHPGGGSGVDSQDLSASTDHPGPPT